MTVIGLTLTSIPLVPLHGAMSSAKIHTIKAIREAIGMGLADAKAASENLPQTFTRLAPPGATYVHSWESFAASLRVIGCTYTLIEDLTPEQKHAAFREKLKAYFHSLSGTAQAEIIGDLMLIRSERLR